MILTKTKCTHKGQPPINVLNGVVNYGGRNFKVGHTADYDSESKCSLPRKIVHINGATVNISPLVKVGGDGFRYSFKQAIGFHIERQIELARKKDKKAIKFLRRAGIGE